VWDWLQIDTLWVDEAARGRGHGRALVQRAEQIARERGCLNARVDTFDFEARGFYAQLGYRVYGELIGFPHGHSHLHLAKRFGASDAG
jgi:ribosomal protein S18 acetylase RimI-like enzyme